MALHLHFTAETMSLEVLDDGVGFDPQMVPAEGRGGLRTIAERTERLGGKLTYESTPGEGTRVKVEVTLLRLIAQGLSNQGTADRIAVSESAIRAHVSRILDKLHLASRTQAALYAVREGLADADGEQEE